MDNPTLYDRDFLLWTEQQAECLKKGDWTELDVVHLVEEPVPVEKLQKKLKNRSKSFHLSALLRSNKF